MGFVTSVMFDNKDGVERVSSCTLLWTVTYTSVDKDYRVRESHIVPLQWRLPIEVCHVLFI
jgi:hypothetical protein